MAVIDPGAMCPSCESTSIRQNPEAARSLVCESCGVRFDEARYP